MLLFADRRLFLLYLGGGEYCIVCMLWFSASFSPNGDVSLWPGGEEIFVENFCGKT